MLPRFFLLFKHLLIAIAKGMACGWRDDWSDSDWLYLSSFPSLVDSSQAHASQACPVSDSVKMCGLNPSEVTGISIRVCTTVSERLFSSSEH